MKTYFNHSIQSFSSNWKKNSIFLIFTVLFLGIVYFLSQLSSVSASSLIQEEARLIITGQVFDQQGIPISEVEITALQPGMEEPLDQTESLENGVWSVTVPIESLEALEIEFVRDHFKTQTLILEGEELGAAKMLEIINLGKTILERNITPGFWVAVIIFIGVLLVIALEKLHNMTAALAGVSAIFGVHYVVGAINPGFRILGFDRGLSYVNWEVIFLVMGMMIVVAIIEGTGVFQWMAFQAYRLSRGHTWVLLLILMAITAVASALLDNFTTMLLMTPISLQIGLALGINPLAFIIPEVLASNVGGISTLIGTPTNILIGAHADIGFTDFLINQTGGVVIALVAMAVYILYHYRDEWRKHAGGISKELYDQLKKNAQIKDINALKVSGIVFVLIMTGFVVGEQYHVVPAIPAMIGATILLVWLKPNVHSTIHAVDWTTLVFFIALFIVVGAVQEVGVMALVAEWMLAVVGDNLNLGIFIIVIGIGTISTFIANIPLAASMLPIVDFLTGSVPGASNKVLYYALSMGAAMGGNGLLIGAEANLVTVGITQSAGHPISFKEFFKVGMPVTFITLIIGFVWLIIRF